MQHAQVLVIGCYGVPARPVYIAQHIDERRLRHQDRVARVDHDEIDRINILQASFRAMHLALDKLKLRPKLLLIDGNRFVRYKRVPHHCIVKGDSLYASIAAASILAKTWRDEYMQRLHAEFPHYRWDSNKGYGTREHREAIDRFGLCKYHRKSFNISPAADIQEELEFTD